MQHLALRHWLAVAASFYIRDLVVDFYVVAAEVFSLSAYVKVSWLRRCADVRSEMPDISAFFRGK